METPPDKKLLTIAELSAYLNIKKATLYAWSAQGKIPRLKIHGLIRFQKDEVDRWAESFRKERPDKPLYIPRNQSKTSVDILIDRAKREAYNSHCGETTPISSPRKEG